MVKVTRHIAEVGNNLHVNPEFGIEDMKHGDSPVETEIRIMQGKGKKSPPPIPPKPFAEQICVEGVVIKNEDAKPRCCSVGRGLLIAAAIIAAIGAALIIGGAVTLAVATTALVASIGVVTIAAGSTLVFAGALLGVTGVALMIAEAKKAKAYNNVQYNQSISFND